MSREVHVPLCDQQRLARSAGDSPAGARARRSVAWMAGRRETGALKPIDDTTRGVVASHRAVTRVNAQVAPKVNGPEAVEFATLEWVDWFNMRRLLGPIGDVPPAEFEAQYYEQAKVA